MSRPRDSQRERLYEAERALWAYSPDRKDVTAGGRLETLPEVQRYVNRILRSQWYRKTFRRAARLRPGIWVKDRRNNGAAQAWGGCIEMPRWSRCRMIVLHEMAHCIADAEYTRNCLHDRDFARTYLALVDRWIGKEIGRALRASFRAHRVRWHPRRPGAGNPEALAQWRAAASPKT